MATGIVKTYIDAKGFGLIVDDDGEDRFFHQSDFAGDTGDLTRGRRVTFEPTETAKGLRAINVGCYRRTERGQI